MASIQAPASGSWLGGAAGIIALTITPGRAISAKAIVKSKAAWCFTKEALSSQAMPIERLAMIIAPDALKAL
jgi:hypothetical protein